MGEKFEKVKAFCKEHKKEITVAVVAGVGVAVGVIIGKKAFELLPKDDVILDVNEILNVKEGKVSHVIGEFKGASYEIIGSQLEFEHLDMLKEAVVEASGNFKPDTKVIAMIGTKLIEDC